MVKCWDSCHRRTGNGWRSWTWWRMCLTALELFIPLVCYLRHGCPNSNSRQQYLVCTVERSVFYWSTSISSSLARDSPHPTPTHPLFCLLMHFFPELPPPKEGGNVVNKTGSWYWLKHSPPCLTCRDPALYNPQNLHLESQCHLERLNEHHILFLFSAL